MDQKGLLLITIFILLLVNNVVQKMQTQVTNTIALYKLINALLLLICFKLVMKSMKFLSILRFILIFQEKFLEC